MNISGLSGAGRNEQPMGAGMAEDAESKSIKNEIARVQKKLQDLAANDKISLEEKMKRRQELQKQLSELNSKLRAHQIEQRRKASETEKKQKGNEVDNLTGRKKDERENPAAEMVLSADAALKQAKAQDTVIAKQKGKAGVLEAEIKLDSSRGRNVEAKQEELADIESRMAETRGAQAKGLGDASRAIGEARKEEKALKEEEEEKDKEKSEKEKSEQENPSYMPVNILL